MARANTKRSTEEILKALSPDEKRKRERTLVYNKWKRTLEKAKKWTKRDAAPQQKLFEKMLKEAGITENGNGKVVTETFAEKAAEAISEATANLSEKLAVVKNGNGLSSRLRQIAERMDVLHAEEVTLRKEIRNLVG